MALVLVSKAILYETFFASSSPALLLVDADAAGCLGSVLETGAAACGHD
jgi:hypothetical protein